MDFIQFITMSLSIPGFEIIVEMLKYKQIWRVVGDHKYPFVEGGLFKLNSELMVRDVIL